MVRKDRELSLADFVLAPSSLTQRTVAEAGFSVSRVKVIPYAVYADEVSPEITPRQPLVVCAGIISMRKGVHRLLRVWKRLKAHQTHRLLLIGDMHLAPGFLKDYRGLYEHVPRMPRPSLLEQFDQARLLVFNSLGDGFGMVVTEAMARGTAVLVSRNAGSSDRISDGIEGRLVDYGDDDQLATVLDQMLSRPDELREMGVRGRQKVCCWTWAQFGDEFAAWIKGTVLAKP